MGYSGFLANDLVLGTVDLVIFLSRSWPLLGLLGSSFFKDFCLG